MAMNYRFHPDTDLFKFAANIPNVYYAHCISANAAMGKGIAVEFVNRFPECRALKAGAVLPLPLEVGCSYLTGPVINLVTKPMHYHKPTYDTIRAAIVHMRDNYLVKHNHNGVNITQLCMPRIGCGLDGLHWDKVFQILLTELRYINVDVHVCAL